MRKQSGKRKSASCFAEAAAASAAPCHAVSAADPAVRSGWGLLTAQTLLTALNYSTLLYSTLLYSAQTLLTARDSLNVLSVALCWCGSDTDQLQPCSVCS